jgi:hypothetical protein
MFREVAQGTTQHFMKMMQNNDADGSKADDEDADADHKLHAAGHGTEAAAGAFLRARLLQSSHFIPLRISEDERVYLRLLEGALEVSEYTDKVDVARGWSWRNSKHDVIREEIGDLLQLILGLQIAGNYKEGEHLVAGVGGLQGKAELFQKVIEIGRRYKITNPEKMRGTYGKLVRQHRHLEPLLYTIRPCTLKPSMRTRTPMCKALA